MTRPRLPGESALVRVAVVLLLVGAVATPLAAAGNHAGNSNSKGNVAQHPPQSQGPDMSGNDDDGTTVGVQVNPSAGTTTSVQVSVDVDDNNGHNDVSFVNMTVFEPDNSTVHVAESTATKDSGNGRRATYVYTFTMQYYDDPGTYYVQVVATDRDGNSDTVWTEFTFEELAALNLGVTTVDLDDGAGGTIAPGSDTHSSPTQVDVENFGNVQIDLQYSGTDLTNTSESAHISVFNLHWSDASNMSNERSFNTSAQTDTSFDLVHGSGSTQPVHVAFHVPEGKPSATYTGTITLSAVANT